MTNGPALGFYGLNDAMLHPDVPNSFITILVTNHDHDAENDDDGGGCGGDDHDDGGKHEFPFTSPVFTARE